MKHDVIIVQEVGGMMIICRVLIAAAGRQEADCPDISHLSADISDNC